MAVLIHKKSVFALCICRLVRPGPIEKNQKTQCEIDQGRWRNGNISAQKLAWVSAAAGKSAAE